MKNHTLPSRVIPLSLLISAALAVPTLSIAMPSDSADSAAMDMQVEPTQEDMRSAAMNQPAIDSDNAAAVDDVAPRDPEMRTYNQPYNDQNAQPTMDPSNDLNSSDSSSVLNSNPSYQTADANSPDINRTDINNPDINNSQVDSLAKAEAEMLNPEMQAYDQPYNDQNAQPTMDPSNDLNSSDSSSVLNSNPSYQTADANSPDINRTDINRTDINRTDINRTDINRTDINNPDINNPQVDSLAKAEAEMLNPEMQAQSELSVPNPQQGNIDSQPLIAGESATDNTIEVASTLQEKKKDSRGELLATQPAELEISEARYLVSANSRSNSLPNKQTL